MISNEFHVDMADKRASWRGRDSRKTNRHSPYGEKKGGYEIPLQRHPGPVAYWF
jgi:hypothetical protein